MDLRPDVRPVQRGLVLVRYRAAVVPRERARARAARALPDRVLRREQPHRGLPCGPRRQPPRRAVSGSPGCPTWKALATARRCWQAETVVLSASAVGSVAAARRGRAVALTSV